MWNRRGIDGIVATALVLGLLTGCAAPIAETEQTEPAEVVLAPARPQDDYYGYMNWERLENVEFEPGAQTAGEAFDSQIVDDEIEGIIQDCVAGSGYRVGTEEYVIQHAYNCYLDYDFESEEAPEQLDELLHQIDSIQSIDEYMTMDAMLYRDYGVRSILLPEVDTSYLYANRYCIRFNNYTEIGDVEFKTLSETYAPLNSLKQLGSAMLQAVGHDREEADQIGTEFGYLCMDLYNASTPEIYNCGYPVQYIQSLTFEEAEDILSNINLTAYLDEIGYDYDTNDNIIIIDRSQLEGLNQILTEENLEGLKAWMMYSFYDRYQRFIANCYDSLASVAQIDYASDEDRAIAEISNSFVDQTDVLYVEQYWSDEMDEALISMCDDIKEGYRNLISNATWLSEEARAGLLRKLENIVYVTGGNLERLDPNDYAGLTYDNYLDLYIQNARIRRQNEINMLSSEYDRQRAGMAMQTFNACYNSSYNNITITVAITNAPFFDFNADYYTNLGGLGMVIGHEMGHAFDDTGILFDDNGVYNPDWVSSEDYNALVSRNEEAIAYYEDNFEVFGVYHVDGEQTLGENYADLGSLECITSLAHNDEELQLLFENFAAIWCSKVLDETLIWQLANDEHSPSYIRVNANLCTLDAFYEAYDVEPGDGMYIAPENRISRWY